MVKDELNDIPQHKPLSDTALAAWEDKINQEIQKFLADRKGDQYSDEYASQYPSTEHERAQ